MELAVIGSDDFITGFRLAGIKAIAIAKGKELEEKLNEFIGKPNIGIIALEEDDFDNISNAMKKRLEKIVTPVVIPISKGREKADLQELIKRCVGVDLWKK